MCPPSDDTRADRSAPQIPWHRVQWADGAHLALPAPHHGEITDAFGLAPLELTHARSGTWTGSRDKGAAVNAYDARLSIHSAGTHTECVAHISDLPLSIDTVAPLSLLSALLLDVQPTAAERGEAITARALQAAWDTTYAPRSDIEPPTAAIIRSRPADASPHTQWTGTHPPFFTPDALRFLVSKGIDHLVTDLPSVDPEDDGGALHAHRVFFGLEGGGRQRTHRATITELAWIPATLHPCVGVLRLDVLAWPTDAAPSRPVFYPISPQDG